MQTVIRLKETKRLLARARQTQHIKDKRNTSKTCEHDAEDLVMD